MRVVMLMYFQSSYCWSNHSVIENRKRNVDTVNWTVCSQCRILLRCLKISWSHLFKLNRLFSLMYFIDPSSFSRWILKAADAVKVEDLYQSEHWLCLLELTSCLMPDKGYLFNLPACKSIIQQGNVDYCYDCVKRNSGVFAASGFEWIKLCHI